MYLDRHAVKYQGRALHEGRKATDPRDYVYGIMGLLSDDEVLASNYNEPVHETFIRAAVVYMKKTLRLDIFSDIPHCTPIPGWSMFFPSWVPDWRIKQEAIPVEQYNTIMTNNMYCACGNPESLYLQIDGDMRKVGIAGIFVDTVAKVEAIVKTGWVGKTIRE
jgi:hypothetical protein